MRWAHAGRACQCGEVAGARVGAEHASDGLDGRMHADALDDVVAVDEGSPGEPEEVGEPRVEEGIVDLFGRSEFSEELFEASRTLRVKATRELADGVLLV